MEASAYKAFRVAGLGPLDEAAAYDFAASLSSVDQKDGDPFDGGLVGDLDPASLSENGKRWGLAYRRELLS